MSNDPWAINDDKNGKRDLFYQTRFEFEEVSGISKKTGKPYKPFNKVKIILTPFEPEKQIKEHKTVDFKADWKRIIVPSVIALAQTKKIKTPNDMIQDQFCVIQWREYRSRDAYEIKKKKDEGYEQHISIDEYGEYVLHIGPYFKDIFPDEESWRRAAEVNTENTDQQIELPTDNEPPQQLKDSLVTLIKHKFPDMAALQGEVLSIKQYKEYFALQDDFVKNEVANCLIVKAGNDETKQIELLKEVNAGLNLETPYLTKDDLPEIAF